MSQLDLFTDRQMDALKQAPFQPHSDTSREAAKAVDRGSAKAIDRERVLHFVYSRRESGATDEEIQRHYRMLGNTERPRRIELVADGLICDSGRTRATESGRQAVVWVAVELAGKEAKR